MILIVFTIEGDKGGAHPEVDEFQAEVDGLLGLFGKFLAKYLTAFLIFVSLIYGCMLIASTDAIVTSFLFTPNSSSLSFRLEAWTMESRE